MADIMRELFGGKLMKTGEERSIKEKCATDLALFAKTYLPHIFPSEWSRFHLETISRIEEILYTERVSTHDVITAPRGHAKSTTVDFLTVVHEACYPTDNGKFILLVSATVPIVKAFIQDIRNELETNEAIRRDFGDLKDPNMWNAMEFKTTSGVLVVGKASGQQCRGLKANGGQRPSMVLIDDLESEEDVNTKAAAFKLEDWFSKDLLPVGNPRCKYIFIGTVLSYNSLLWKLLKEPRYSMWRRKIYRAVEQFSDDTEDWDEWERIMLDPQRDDPFGDATEYYNQHKEAMLRGTKVLWEKQRENMYLHLMCQRLANEDSFNSEYQNNPVSERTRIFKDEWIEANQYDTDKLPEIVAVSAAIDPSLGKTRKSDTSAIIFVGLGNDNLFYILEASVCVRKPQALIEDSEAFIKRWYAYNPLITIETNVFQSFFASTVQQHFNDVGIAVRWNEIIHTAGNSKEQRILTLVPYIKSGRIKFPRDGARTLKTQLRNFPRDHDDGPDALEMALRPLIQTNRANFSFGSVKLHAPKEHDMFTKLTNGFDFGV